MTEIERLQRVGASSRQIAGFPRRELVEQVTAPGFDTAGQWYGNTVILGANVLAAATSVTVADTSPFQEGASVSLSDAVSQEWLTVKSLVANTSVTFTTALVNGYTTANNARLCVPREAMSFSRVTGLAWANQASAANGLTIQQSLDGINWDYISEWTLSDSTELAFSVELIARYVRLGLLHAGVAPTVLRIGAYLRP